MLTASDDVPCVFVPQPWNPARCRKCYKKEADHKRPEVAKSDVEKESAKVLENNSETKFDVQVESDKSQCDIDGNHGDVSAVVTIRAVPVESKWKGMQTDPKSPVSSSSSLNSKSSTQTNVKPRPTDSFTFNADIEKCNSILEDYVQGKPIKREDATSTLRDAAIADKESKVVLEQLQAKLKEKENRCSQLEAENQSLLGRPPQFDKSMAEELIELRTKLAESESKYRTLLQENCMMKQEVYALQVEVDEMQDQFREEEAEEFKEIQKELEIAAKNCRILQYKLRKSEKRNDELESDRQHFEERLRELEEKTAKTEEERKLINELDEELIVAKEVSVRLHDELETSEERRAKVEEDFEALQKQLADLIAEKQQLEHETKQKDKNQQDETTDKPAPLIMSLSTDPASGELQGMVSLKPQTGSLERTRSTDSESQLMRDLCETVERERDLREQLRFSENEAKELRKKVSQLESDNETMNLQLQKMASDAMKAPFRPGLHKKNIPQTSNATEERIEDSVLDANELKLQIEVTEQENKVMRRKMLELEQELENRITEVTTLQEKLIVAISDKAKHSEPAPPSDIKPDAYYEQKLKILEDEVFQLRKKLVERERENERLSTSLGLELRKKKDAAQKTAKMFTRSRSLDSENAEDDSKETTIENEISLMRSKLGKLETENEKLQHENKRLVMLHSRKIPVIQVDDQAQENIQLTSKVQILEGECTELEDKCARLENQLRKSRKEEQRAGKAADNKGKPLEKMDSLELEMSEALQQKVRDLQEEIEDLLVIVKGRESTNEQLEEELQTYKHEMQRATQDHKEKQDKLMEELKKALDNNADMALQLQIMVQRAEYAQKELDDVMKSRDQPPSTPERPHKQLERQSSSKYEKILSERVQVLEKQLAEEQLKLTMAEFKTNESSYSSMTDDARVQHIQNQKITQLEKQLSDQKQDTALARKKLELEILALEQECSRFKHHSEAVTSKLEETAKIALESQDKYNSLADKFNKDKVKWERERTEIESHFEQELKVRDQEIADKTEHAKLKESELEEIKSLAAAKEANAEKSIAKIDTLEVNYRARLKEMSDLLVREREKLTIQQQRFSRYEDAVKKEHATLAVARGQLENTVAKLKAEKEVLETDLRKVRDTYNSRQDDWIKEKLKKEEEVRSLRQDVLSQMKDASSTPITASERQKLLDDIRRLEIQIDVSKESWTLEKQDLQKDLEQKTKFLKKHKSNEKKLQQEVEKLRSMMSDYERGKGHFPLIKPLVDQTPHEESETLKQKLKAIEEEAKLYKEKFENLEKILKQEEPSGAGGDHADKTLQLKAKLAKLRMDFDKEKVEQRRHHDKARQEWVKEKVDLQFKLRELERDKTKLSLAQNRLKELEGRHKHLQDTLRKERDELKRKLSESEEKRFYDKQEFSEFRNELTKIQDLAALKKLKLKISEKKPMKPSAEKPAVIEEKVERSKAQKPVETSVKKEASKPQLETRKPVRDESWERDKIQLKKTLDEALLQISRVSEDLSKYQKTINEPNGSGELRKDRSHSCTDMPYIDSGLATVSEGGSERIYFSWQDQTTSSSSTPASDTDVVPERERGREGRGPTSLRKGHARSASADSKNQGFFRSVLGQWAEKTVSKIRSRSRSRSPSGASLGDSDTDSIGSNPAMRLVFRKKHESVESPKLLPKMEGDSTLKKHKVKVKKKKDGEDSKPRLIKSVSFDLATCPSSSEETAVLADDSRQRENVNMMQKLRQVSLADKIENVETKTPPPGGSQSTKEQTSSAPKLQSSSVSTEYSIPMRRTGSKDAPTPKSVDNNKTDDDKSRKTHTRSLSADLKTFSTTAKPSSVKSKVELWQSKFSSVPEKKKVITTRVGGSTMQSKAGTSSVQNLPTADESKSITYTRPKLSTRSRSLDVDAP